MTEGHRTPFHVAVGHRTPLVALMPFFPSASFGSLLRLARRYRAIPQLRPLPSRQRAPFPGILGLFCI